MCTSHSAGGLGHSPPLTCDDVHAWMATLELGTIALERSASVLSAAERARAAEFRSDPARARYVGARGLLRTILAGYLGASPESLVFDQNPWGKPSLGGAYSSSDIRFNLSHAGTLALYAITRGREVGIDVEECVPGRSTADIAARCFSPLEIASLKALPHAAQTRAFFATWTRKEAYAKARGQGLSLPLSRFSVEVDPQQPPRLIEAEPPSEIARWAMHSLVLPAPYEGTVVVEGSGWRIRSFAAK